MGKALWLSCDFGREKGLWDVLPVGEKKRTLVKDKNNKHIYMKMDYSQF